MQIVNLFTGKNLAGSGYQGDKGQLIRDVLLGKAAGISGDARGTGSCYFCSNTDRPATMLIEMCGRDLTRQRFPAHFGCYTKAVGVELKRMKSEGIFIDLELGRVRVEEMKI
jgi:hypothetical protein